jgi:transcriptional regulator with XRE-family HTH domain
MTALSSQALESQQLAATLAAMTAKALLSARLRQLLYEKQMRSTDLARVMGKSFSWASAVVRGKNGVDFDTLDQLARVLEVTVPDLFTDQSAAHSPQLSKGAPRVASSSVPSSASLHIYAEVAAWLFDEAVARSGMAPAPRPAHPAPAAAPSGARRHRRARHARPRKLKESR